MLFQEKKVVAEQIRGHHLHTREAWGSSNSTCSCRLFVRPLVGQNFSVPYQEVRPSKNLKSSRAYKNQVSRLSPIPSKSESVGIQASEYFKSLQVIPRCIQL